MEELKYHYSDFIMLCTHACMDAHVHTQTHTTHTNEEGHPLGDVFIIIKAVNQTIHMHACTHPLTVTV